jgi:tetratricopeptide (TPR) repeat protein
VKDELSRTASLDWTGTPAESPKPDAAARRLLPRRPLGALRIVGSMKEVAMLPWTLLLLGAITGAGPSPPARAVEAQMTEPAARAEAEIQAGLEAFRRLRFREAEARFEAAVQADPTSAAATFYLGYTVYKRAEPKRPFHPDKRRAAELFARAFELDPGFRPVWAR